MDEQLELMTAIVTPFNDGGDVDYPALDRLTDRLIADGTQGFIVAGTTGESPTLTQEEKLALFQYFANRVSSRARVIANVGSNNTAASADLARQASAITGIDGVLAVAPYYNKPNQAGMVAHFTAIADASAVPVMLYNIPGRTNVTMSNETILTLAQHPNINAVKQCTNIDDIQYLAAHAPAGFAVYTGEDDAMLASVRAGAAGVISVASHFYGKVMRRCLALDRAGEHEAADDLMRWLTPRMHALFSLPSPAPTKAWLEQRGEIRGDLRLPLVRPNAAEAQQLFKILEAD